MLQVSHDPRFRIQIRSTLATLYTCAMLAIMIPIGSHPLWHPVFEAASYVAGYLVFRHQRARQGDVVDESKRWTVLAGAALGALAGSRVLGLAEQWPTLIDAYRAGRLLPLLLSPGGKTIVGGLLGAWLGAEIAKKLSDIHTRTGDLFALPLCIGIAIGRVGCLIAGLADDTYGKPTHLPWAVDLGDSIGRHPVQIYEILFLALVANVVSSKLKFAQGDRFRIFLASYLGWRFCIDFLKPQPLVYGMNLIQWSCLVGLLMLAIDWLKSPRRQHECLRT
jgi:prolipoprotein diacylglyceryltransferase